MIEDDADRSIEDEVLEHELNDFAAKHGVARGDLESVRDRVERFELDQHGLVDAPRLFEMVECGVDAKAAVRWLLECDLERESSFLRAWELLAGSSSRRAALSALPEICRQGGAYLAAHLEPLKSLGEAIGDSGWLERELSRCWRRGLFRLREAELGTREDCLLRPQDSALIPEARALMGELRASLLLEAELAINGKAPASLWARTLHGAPSSVTGAFLSLAGRLDSALIGYVRDEPIGGLGDLLNLGIHFESELLFGDWVDVHEDLLDIDVSKGFYELRMGGAWTSLQQTLVTWITNEPRREAYRESREREMIGSLRSLARARHARLLWRIAAGDSDTDISTQLGRWTMSDAAEARAGRRHSRSEAISSAVVLTLGPEGYFMVSGRAITYESGGRVLKVGPGNATGRLLRYIVEHGECKLEQVASRERTNLAKALVVATKGVPGGAVDLQRATSKPTRPLEFDATTRRIVAKYPAL